MSCHRKFDIKNLKFCVWQTTSTTIKTFRLLGFKYIADKFQTLDWYWKGGGEMNSFVIHSFLL